MTDQIYYRVQYPLKKAIEIIKNVDQEDPVPGGYSEEELKEIKDFIDKWDNNGREQLKGFIDKLKEV